MISRRQTLALLAVSPLAPACAPSKPKTPLAHLYGEQWVHGAYELYAKSSRDVEVSAEASSFEAYRTLAKKGIVALDALQSRGVPFHVRADDGRGTFSLERNVPERLTFTADMSEKQRREAQASFERAREHLHTDYEEIRRLNAALSRLLDQTRRVRNAIEAGRVEQYQIVRKLDALGQGGPPPFELPYQVTPRDYEGVLVLLLERLDDDAARLRATEASIVSVGLVARATDAGSGSLAANLHQMLLAVVRDAEGNKPREARFPDKGDEHGKLSSKGKQLAEQIRGSEGYKAWLKAEREREHAQVGAWLTLLDQMTHLPLSSVYKQVVDIWSGDADYLSYLKTLSSFVPGGSQVASTLTRGIELTAQVRDVTRSLSGDGAIAALAKQKGLAMLNTQTSFGADRLGRQLAFVASPRDLDQAREALAASSLLKG